MEIKSKSQIKREMLALQILGERLVNLPAEQMNKMGLPPELHDAILFAKSIKSRTARRREVKHIGVLLREIDVDPIVSDLDDTARIQRRETEAFHHLEIWRNRLLEGDDVLLEEILQRFPDADRQGLTQLVRNARTEKNSGKPPKSARALFRYLRELSGPL